MDYSNCISEIKTIFQNLLERTIIIWQHCSEIHNDKLWAIRNFYFIKNVQVPSI